MMVLRADSLEKRGIPYRTAQSIVVRGRTLQKGESFSKRVYSVAIAQCERLQVEGIFCLLVESGDLITLWREVQPQHLSGKSRPEAMFYNPPLRSEKPNVVSSRKLLTSRFFDWVQPTA